MIHWKTLRDDGIEVERGLRRYLGNQEKYIKNIQQITEDESFLLLGDALKKGNYKDAFEYAHAAKSLCSNLSFKILYEETCVLVDELRGNKRDNALNHYEHIWKAYNDTITAIQSLD